MELERGGAEVALIDPVRICAPYAQRPDAPLDEQVGGALDEVRPGPRQVLGSVRDIAPPAGMARAQVDDVVPADPLARAPLPVEQLIATHRDPVVASRSVDDDRAPRQGEWPDLVGGRGAGDELERRVDVGADMQAGLQDLDHRDVAGMLVEEPGEQDPGKPDRHGHPGVGGVREVDHPPGRKIRAAPRSD